MANVVKALSGVCTLDDIRIAFESDHELVSADVTVEPDPHNRVIEISGVFKDRRASEWVGKFVRKIEMVDKRFRVHHSVIEIDPRYWRRGIAREHYTRAIRFYYGTLHADQVYMKADFLGPSVWGDFGFEFTEPDWDLLMRALDLVHQSHYGCPPEFYPKSATELANLIGDEGFEIGIEVIGMVHAGAKDSGGLKMVLNLDDEGTIEFLRDEGIL
ncbi:MAG TPA: hypothetical protein VFN37_08555 [Candidatus Baltobacteraceae bacterium]|nr:hypothetical protein [Candidatus Baltobacteraceae bacterium]